MAEKTKIPCPECGYDLAILDSGEFYCARCKETRVLEGSVWSRLEQDDLPKSVRALLILLALILIVGTVGIFIKSQFFSELDEKALDRALRERGALQGEITVSVIWDSIDDLDLRVFTPSGAIICYSNAEAEGGKLDVDANSNEDSIVSTPVENIYFEQPATGDYQVVVHNFADRTQGKATSYLARITVSGISEVYRGTIDGENTDVQILTFHYGPEKVK